MEYRIPARPDPDYRNLSDVQVAAVIYEALRMVWNAHGRPDNVPWASVRDEDRARMASFVAHVRRGGKWPLPPERRDAEERILPQRELDQVLARLATAIVHSLDEVQAPSANQLALGAGDPKLAGCEFCQNSDRTHAATKGVCPELDRRSGVTRGV